MNRTQRNVLIAVILLIFSALVAAILQPTLTNRYFEQQKVMTLEESHNATLKEGYGKVYVIDTDSMRLDQLSDLMMVKDKLNCYPNFDYRARYKLAGAWNPAYVGNFKGEDKFYVVWVVDGCAP